jgi:hypothetical protein
VLRALPDGFLHRYEQLWLRTFGGAVGGRDSGGVVEPNVVAPTRRVVRLTTSQTETRGGAHSGHKLAGAGERGVVSSEAALSFKRKVDAEIRKINRLMKVWLESGGVGQSLGRRCVGCKRFGDETWSWCPYCRGAMEERDA